MTQAILAVLLLLALLQCNATRYVPLITSSDKNVISLRCDSFMSAFIFEIKIKKIETSQFLKNLTVFPQVE